LGENANKAHRAGRRKKTRCLSCATLCFLIDMDEYLLTFELDGESEQIFVHGDPAGLEYFAKSLLRIAEKAKEGEFPHDHFFTEEWGGSELSSEPQGKEGKLINHVKVYGWPNKEGAKPYEKT